MPCGCQDVAANIFIATGEKYKKQGKYNLKIKVV